jgi:hypothetical protein
MVRAISLVEKFGVNFLLIGIENKLHCKKVIYFPVPNRDAPQRYCQKIGKNILRKDTAWTQSQIIHTYICERFIYSHDRSAYLAAAKWIDPGNL